MSRSVAFIGTGIMGKPMVLNLLKARHSVAVHNRSKPPLEELEARRARSYADLHPKRPRKPTSSSPVFPIPRTSNWSPWVREASSKERERGPCSST